MIEMSGHSGCLVNLIDDKVVRKRSKDVSYNERLLKQIEKQKSFTHNKLKTPKIYDVSYINGLVYFDMEYVRGTSFSEFCLTENFGSIEPLMSIFFSRRKTGIVNFETQLIDKCKTLPDFPVDLLSMCSWDLSSELCHGDLTFDNIIVSDDGVYVIDFLDSFIESPDIDESKFMQDTYCGWSYRDASYLPIHNLYLMNEMIESKRNYLLLLVHLYRILPYATRETQHWIRTQISRVERKVNVA
tara:strand:- start:33 stop:761 length:729 start_codon:yes stop_codon:yes gene_type:complete